MSYAKMASLSRVKPKHSGISPRKEGVSSSSL